VTKWSATASSAPDLAFQVPATETAFTLLWTPHFMGNDIAVPIK
jgi:hypothetical protein